MTEGWVRRVHSTWSKLWFEPGDPENLAAARVIVAAHAMWVLWSWDIAALTALPTGFYEHVQTSTQWRFLLFPGHYGVERFIELLAGAALVAVLVGVWVRWAALLAALLLYHLGPLQSFLVNTNSQNRGFTIAVLSLVVLSAARSADVWRVGITAAKRPVNSSWEYTWPLRMMQMFVAQVYLFSLWGKLFHGGWQWFTPRQIARHFVLNSHVIPGRELTSLGTVIGGSVIASSLVLVLLIVIEGGFIATLFSRKARRVLVPLAAAGHLAILMTMQIFYVNAFYLLLFVNWAWLADRLRRGTLRPKSSQTEPTSSFVS